MAVPYPLIARSFRRHTVIPFLGAAASSVGASGGPPLPGGPDLAKSIAEIAVYPGNPTDSLPKVAQYMEEIAGGRSDLREHLNETFCTNVSPKYRSCITDFLSDLPKCFMPSLIVTTNYDLLTERTLANRNIPYLAVSHIVWGSPYAGRFACYESLDASMQLKTRSELEAYLQPFDTRKDPHVLVYKIHGTSRNFVANSQASTPYDSVDSLVVTETDYVNFLAKDLLKSIPSTIVRRLRSSHLLFLGYSLNDWNFRVLLQRLYTAQRPYHAADKKHWAVLKCADDVERRFWGQRGVNLFSISLRVFLPILLKECLTLKRAHPA